MTDTSWKDTFLPEMVQEMLDNDNTRKLMSAFIWAHTPQGHEFWDEASRNSVLTQEYHEALQELLDQSCAS